MRIWKRIEFRINFNLIHAAKVDINFPYLLPYKKKSISKSDHDSKNVDVNEE